MAAVGEMLLERQGPNIFDNCEVRTNAVEKLNDLIGRMNVVLEKMGAVDVPVCAGRSGYVFGYR